MLVISDIEPSRRELTGRGVVIRHKGADGAWHGGFLPDLNPDGADYASFANFRDPDGNTWVLQEGDHH
jgi:catechol 2,3-dioxygenase-like lactoylglutathione lyase family enzyme